MTDTNVIKLAQPGTFTDSLTEILRNGARALLTQAVETEVADFLGRYADLKTETGRQRVVRHGHLPEREIMTGIGPVAVRQPARARPRGRRRRADSVQPEHSAALRAAHEEPRSADPDPLLERHLHRRLRGGAGRVARQGRRRAVGLDHRAPEGGLGRTSTPAGASATCPPSGTSTSGPMASTSRPGSKMTRSACW